jgi:hypothetical protein
MSSLHQRSRAVSVAQISHHNLSNHPTSNRLISLDFLKALSIVSVVSFHAVFVPVSTYQASAPTLDILFSPLRFCVPTLLVLSFFLLERSAQKSTQTVGQLLYRRLQRLAIPTAFWFSLAAVKLFIQGKSPANILYAVVTGDIFTGAYYLIILFQMIPIALCLRQWIIKKDGIIAWVVALQSLSFFIFYCSVSMLSPETLAFLQTMGRSLFLYWLAYPALGIWIYHHLSSFKALASRLTARVKCSFLCAIAFCFMAEYSYLSKLFENQIPPFEYLMISCVVSAPTLLLCSINITEARLPPWMYQSIVMLSKYSLGIFCINGILSQIFLFMGEQLLGSYTFTFLEILAIKFVGWTILLLLSLWGAIALEKIGLKRVVC